MLDPKLLRTDLDNTARALARRGFVLDTAALARLEERRKQVQVTFIGGEYAQHSSRLDVQPRCRC